jgi:hypothetical protein
VLQEAELTADTLVEQVLAAHRDADELRRHLAGFQAGDAAAAIFAEIQAAVG